MQLLRAILFTLLLCAGYAFADDLEAGATVRPQVGSTHHATPTQDAQEALQSADMAVAWGEGGLPPGFRKVRELGKGSFATAVLAQEESTGQLRVLKISLRGSASDAELFAREQALTNRASATTHSPAVLYRNPTTGQSVISMPPVFSDPREESLALPLSEIISAQTAGPVTHLPPNYQITVENLPLWKQALDSEVERLHRLGINHNDIHLDNVLVSTDKDGKPAATLIDFGLSSTNTDAKHPLGASLFQSHAKLSGGPFDPKASDRYAARVLKAFMFSVANEEKFSVEVQVPGGKVALLPPTVAAAIKEELKEFVAPAAKPIPPKPLSARQQQMLCEAKYAELWTPPPVRAPARREVAGIRR